MGRMILDHALAASWPILVSLMIVAWSRARAGVQQGWGRDAGPCHGPNTPAG